MNQATVHCKKRLAIFPSFPTWVSLVSDIPAGAGKSLTFFLHCIDPALVRVHSEYMVDGSDGQTP